MNKPFITSKFDEDVQEYNKETGSATGTNSVDDSSFKDNLVNYLKSVKDGSFLSGGLKKLNLSLKKLKNLGLLSIDKTKSGLLDKLKDTKLATTLSSTGFASFLKLGTLSEKIFNKLTEQVIGAALSKLFIPDPVYLTSLIAHDLSGADLEVNDNYIRKLILKRDITIALKWWNKEWEIEYSGLPSDPYTSDALVSARNGCFKNVEYILGEFKKSHSTVLDTLKTIPEVVKTKNMTQTETDNYNKRLRIKQYADSIYGMMVYVLKELIVNSYSNFTADELRNILNKTGIQPSVFGLTDTKFGGRYSIKNYDVDACAPYFNILSTSSIDTTNRSSRYRRKYMKEHDGRLPPKKSTSLNMINPRNRNIKRLYLTLVSNDFESPMYNPYFAKRLQCKIANIFIKTLNTASATTYSKVKEDLWNSAYDFTVGIQDFLFNPATVSDLKLVDTDIIKMPEEIKTVDGINIKNNTVNISNNTNTLLTNRDERRTIITNTIGPTLVVDSIKRDVTNYMNQPYVPAPIYDNLGNRIIRDGNGGFILANSNGVAILDNNNNTIPVDPSLVPLVPQDTRNPKVIVPTNLDEYIKRLVDSYLTLNVKDVINSVLLNIKTNNTLVQTTDTIERLSYEYFIQNGGMFVNEININQVMVIIINNIKNGIITPTILSEKPLSDLMTETVADLKINNLYEPTFNGESVINKVKLSISILQDNIDKIKDGTLDPVNIPTFETIQTEATSLDEKGVVSYFGSIDGVNTTTARYDKISNNGNFSDAMFLSIQHINNNLIEAFNKNIESLNYIELLGKFSSFNDIVKYYEGNLKEISVPTEIKLLKEELIEIINDIIKDIIILPNGLPEFVDIFKISIEKAAGKYDLSEVMDVLKDFGVDVTGYDIMSYYRELDKVMNEKKEEWYYDFDVINPPKEVTNSLEEEYSTRMNFRSKYYIWVKQL